MNNHYIKGCVKRLFSVIISFCVAITGALYIPVYAAADELADVPLTDDDFDDDSEEEDFDEDEEDYGIDTVINFFAVSISKKSVKLKWDKVEDIDGYELSYKKASSSKWIIKEIPKSKKAVKVSGLKVNTKYNFRIRPYIYYGDDEDYEDEDSEDEDLEFTDEEFEEDSDEEDDEEYEEIEDYEYGEYSNMTFRTLAKDGSGDKQAVSDTYEKAAPKSVKVPVLKKIKTSGGKVNLTWKKSLKASGYEVYMSKKALSRFKRISKINKAGTVKYTSKKLKKDAVYYFKVRAYVKQGSQTSYTSYSKVKRIKVK